MKLQTQPCPRFVDRISAFVDEELAPRDVGRLVDHVRGCVGCQDYVDTLRELSELHRRSADDHDRAVMDQVLPEKLLGSITATLVDEKREALARLFYELGKAYALAGNRALSEKRRARWVVASRPVDIKTTTRQARLVLRETEQLDAFAGRGRGGGLFRRSRQLFKNGDRARAGALARARRFLEEALALRPELDEARLYLGFVFHQLDRTDRARIQFRKVYLDGKDPVHRMMALQSLGNVYADSGDFRRAVECFEEIVADERAEGEPGLFPSFVNLAVNSAQAGLTDKSVESFGRLARRFPMRLQQIRTRISEMRHFQALLRRDQELRSDLQRQVPALFAA